MALVLTSLTPAIGVLFSVDVASLGQYRRMLANPAVIRGFVNSLMLSVAAAAICALIALPMACLVVRRPSPAIALADLLAEGPWVVPGTVVALAMFLAFLLPLPVVGVSLYGSMAIILIAYPERFLRLILRPVVARARSGDPMQDQAAHIAGIGLVGRIAHVFAPSVGAATLAGAILIVMSAMNELTLSALL